MYFSVYIFQFLLIQLSLAHPYENLTITQYIKKYNYPVEVHSTETPDGYILKLHRIPHGITNKVSKEVAFLAHGLGGSAENYIVLEPPNALAFYLADRGFDVWLFNARGTAHCRKHKTLNPDRDRKKFWSFSWHEVGIYDLPTTINYVLSKTGKEKLFYIGHSQGTTSLYVMLSERPEMNEKIKVAVALASAVKLNYTQSPLIAMATKFVPLIQRILEMFNWYEGVIPNSPVLNRILKPLCKAKSMIDVCLDIASLSGGPEDRLINKICNFNFQSQFWDLVINGQISRNSDGYLGHDMKQEKKTHPVKITLLTSFTWAAFKSSGHDYAVGLRETLLPLIIQYTPSGFAVRQIFHYAQVIVSDEFKPYDFGKKKNLRLYNSESPPLYNLSNTKIPVALFYTLQDPFSSVKMNEELARELPNVILKYEVKIDGFSHNDYVIAYNARQIVYDIIYDLFQKVH